MKVYFSTGGARDFIELYAETVSECRDLARVSQSKFIPADRVWLDVSTSDKFCLRIWMSEERPRPSATDAGAQDEVA
jgi:hypothetical protein